jgi:hypothetical protein
MGEACWIILISLSRSGTIGQDEVEATTFTIFQVVFKASELINSPRLEPLFKDLGFTLKFKPGSAVQTVFTFITVITVLSIFTVLAVCLSANSL